MQKPRQNIYNQAEKYTNMQNTYIQYIQMHKAYTNIHKNIQTHKRQTQNMHKDTKHTLNTKHKHTLYIQDIWKTNTN